MVWEEAVYCHNYNHNISTVILTYLTYLCASNSRRRPHAFWSGLLCL